MAEEKDETMGLMKTESGRRLTQILTDDYLNLHRRASE